MFVWLLPEKWHGSIASRAWTPTRRHFNSIDAIWSFIACQRKANFKNVSGQRTSKLQLYIFFKINWRNFSIWLMAEKPKFLRIIRRLYYLILKRNNYLLYWNFDWKSCFLVFFLEWNEWKNPRYNFSSQDLSIEHNFFK